MKKKQFQNWFKRLVDHIDQSWRVKKGLKYPFSGRDFKNLKNMCGHFQEWGVMALWDVFMESTSDWVQKTGYSLDGFSKCLPWLVDDKRWKFRAAKYEKDFPPPPKEVVELFDTSKCTFPKRRESDRVHALHKKALLP